MQHMVYGHLFVQVVLQNNFTTARRRLSIKTIC